MRLLVYPFSEKAISAEFCYKRHPYEWLFLARECHTSVSVPVIWSLGIFMARIIFRKINQHRGVQSSLDVLTRDKVSSDYQVGLFNDGGTLT